VIEPRRHQRSAHPAVCVHVFKRVIGFPNVLTAFPTSDIQESHKQDESKAFVVFAILQPCHALFENIYFGHGGKQWKQS